MKTLQYRGHTMKTLQYQLPTGAWIDVDIDRVTEFLGYCIDNNPGIESWKDAVLAMKSGKELRNHPEDWYSYCRMFDQELTNKRIQEMRHALIERNKKALHCKGDDCC